MKYQLSEEYIKKRKRGILTAAIMFAVVALVLSVLGIVTENYGMFVGFIFFVMSWQSYKGMKTWVDNSEKLRFSFDGQSLVFSGADFESKMVLSSVKKVVVQTKKNHPVSVLLFPSSGSLEKFEGIDDMQSFVAEIKSIVGDYKVKYARFFHR